MERVVTVDKDYRRYELVEDCGKREISLFASGVIGYNVDITIFEGDSANISLTQLQVKELINMLQTFIKE